MAAGGASIAPTIGGGYFNQPPPPISPTSQFGNPATFTAAANTQGSDYDKIMAQYDQLAQASATNPISPTSVNPTNVGSPSPAYSSSVQAPQPINAPNPIRFNQIQGQTTPYTQSKDVTGSLAGLSDLATTGGYSEADKANIRERSISPTRSIYANAQQNAERQRSLAGGYSPNFNAVQAKMARDESDQISGINTNVNAGIAQNVASNRLAAAPAYASASESANAAETAANQRNTDIINQINAFNTQGQQQTDEFNLNNTNDINKFNTQTQAAIAEANANRATQTGQFNTSLAASTAENNANRDTSTAEFNTQAALNAAQGNRAAQQSAIQGKTQLYGTTPALVNTFGNQVVQAGQLGQGQQIINNNRFGQIGNLARSIG